MNIKLALPIEQIFDLGRLSQAEQSVTIAPSPEECARIAAWAGIEAVTAFHAEVALSKKSASQFLAAFKLRASLVQNCVATLEPLTAEIARDFTRMLHFAAAAYRHKEEPQLFDLAQEDGPEEIESLRYDLAGPVLEELVLAIDPYPRKAAFQAPGEQAPEGAQVPDERPESPFAVLKSLKSRS